MGTFLPQQQSPANPRFSFDKGSTVYLLDDSDDNTSVMKSVTPAAVPTNTYENISTIESRLNLPDGWDYRITAQRCLTKSWFSSPKVASLAF